MFKGILKPAPVSPNAASTTTMTPPVSPIGATPGSPPITPSFSTRLTRRPSSYDPDIIEWIQRTDCQSVAEIKNKYSKEGDKVLERALRAFEVLKKPDSIFAPHREKWGIKKLVRVAVAHMDTPFNDIPEVEKYLKNMENTRGKFAAMKSKSKGSLDRLRIEVNLDTVLRFVRNNPTMEQINQHYEDSTEELLAATKMFEVLFADSIFADFRKEWSDERLMIMAKRHVDYPMLTVDAIKNAIADEDAMLAAEAAQQVEGIALVQVCPPRASEYGVFDPLAAQSLRP
jgi:hypothetical protein